MLVHFIGGPAHGITEAHKNPQPTYRVPEVKQRAFQAVREDAPLPPIDEKSYAEYEYRVTRRTRRYCIAEWRPAPVKVQVAVEFNGLEFWDRGVHEKLMRFIDQELGDNHPGRQLAYRRHDFGTGLLTIEWFVEVEGPADAAAISEATEVVQHRLDAALGNDNKYVRQISAAVSADN